MKVYFLSSRPCQLTLNGIYFGTTDRFERFAELSLQDNVFACFTPEGAQPISFFINENICFTPPNGCEVYLLRDKIVLYAKHFPPIDFQLQILSQARFDDFLVTVFKQGEPQLHIQGANSFFNAYLPPSFSKCELTFQGGLLLLTNGETLCVYTQKAELLLCEQILSFSVNENELSARLPLNDSGNRFADCIWTLSKTACVQTRFAISDATATIPDGMLAYAFFESVLIGANYEAMLSDELRPRKEELRAFLGDFISVAQTENPKQCILLRKKSERLFEGAYFTVETENGKITNVVE